MKGLNLYDTDLRVLKLNRDTDYKYIGHGCEGVVSLYDENTVFKVFYPKSLKKRRLKVRKIEMLGKLDDPSFAYPWGFVGYEDEKKEGLFMQRVHTYEKYPNLALLKYLRDKKKKLDILIEGDAGMRRAHKEGVRIGDVRGENILIDKECHPIFIDTDNYSYGGFDFDCHPDRVKWLEKFYGRKFSLKDIDKFLYAVVSINALFEGLDVYGDLSPKFLEELVRKLNVSSEVRSGFEAIFSDSEDKPYVGDLLKEIDSDEKPLSLPKTFILNVKHRR